MSLYIKYSKKVVDVYLSFVAEEDILVYSIDECFLDVTNYLKMYKKTDYALAEEILKKVYEQTGLTANCGIGPNMLLAKVAMDTEAKNTKMVLPNGFMRMLKPNYGKSPLFLKCGALVKTCKET